jgi:glycosyltransferase involved in cell wall biosynthesis
VPFITTYHGLYKAKSDAKRFYNRIMVRGVVTIANSDYTKAHIIAEHGSSIDVRVINRGVDCDLFSPRAETRPARDVIVLPARLTQGKGHFDALTALSLLQPRPKLVFVGEGSLKPALEAEVSRLKLSDVVEFRGHVSDMPAVLAEATLVIAPSTVVESFGRVPIEAGAMGKVCIVSRIGAMQYSVIDGVTGYLCEAGNATMLASLIEKALSNPDLAEMGLAARAHIQAHYGLDVMCEKTIAVYHEILRENQK